jgi:crotonobetainyl-CoA hydratase
MAAYRFITYGVADHVAYVTINRAEVMNALHAEGNAEMRDAFETFRGDEDAWVAILTGAGDKAFSAGNDLKVTAAATGQPDRQRRAPFGGITSGFECVKPIIAAVNGYALGGGFELALACDIIVASDQARFGLPEPRVGLVAAAGGMHRLPQQIPLKAAMGMMLTGRHIDAPEAYRLGIVNEVVPLTELMDTARRWAAQILECSPVSVRITKESVHAGLGLTVAEAMADDQSSGRLRRLYDSEDFREGPRAFAEKRRPSWSGR